MSEQLKRNVYVLSVYSFLRGVGNSIFMTLFPLYLLVLGYSMSDIGAIATISYLISGLIVPFLGLLVDYYGRKPFVILTGLTTVVSLIILGYSTSYILLVTSYALMNFSFLAGQPARGAMLAESVSRERMGEAFGFVTTAFFISRVFMPSIAGFMADTIGYKITFVIGGIIVLLGVLFFWTVSIETMEGGRRPSLKDVMKALRPSKNLSWLYIGVIIDRFSWALWMPLLNAYIEDVYGLGATEIGFLNSIMSFSSLVTQYLSGKWIDKIGYLMGLALSELSGLVAVFLIGFSNSIESLVVGLFSIGLSISLWIPSYNNAIALNTEKEERAVEYSKANSYRTFTAIPAPYIGGYLYDYIGVSAPYLLAMILMMTTTILFYSKTKERSNQSKR